MTAILGFCHVFLSFTKKEKSLALDSGFSFLLCFHWIGPMGCDSSK